MFSYDNIGSKIKAWAKWIFAVEAIASVITGFVLMGNDEEYLILVLAGWLLVILGPCAAWVSSWLLYGYGQLIENSDIIAEEHVRINEKYEKIAAKNNAREQKRIAEKLAQRREAAKATIADPDVDEDAFIDITCPNCKTDLSYPKGQLQNEEGVTCPVCDAIISL